MTESHKQTLRFHDGIGDVLQERRSHRMSLLKPLWVSLTIGCVTILIFVAALNAVLNEMVRKKTLYIPNQVLQQTTQEQDNDAMIKEMEALLAQSAPPLTLPPSSSEMAPSTPIPPTTNRLSPPAVTPHPPSKPVVKAPASPAVTAPAKASVTKAITPPTTKPDPTPPRAAVASQPLPQPPAPRPLPLRSTPKNVASPATIRYRVIIPQPSPDAAVAMRARLKTLGIDAIIKQSGTQTWLQLGAFQQKAKAEETVHYVASKGFDSQMVE